MPDLSTSQTLSLHVLEGCFLTGLGVFGAAAVVRAFSGANARPEPVEAMPPPPPLDFQTPALAPGMATAKLTEVVQLEPRNHAIPEATPGVSTRIYHVPDLLWVGALFLFFMWSAVASAAMPSTGPSKLTAAALVVSIVFQLMLAGTTTGVVIFRIRPAEWLGLRWRNWPWVMLIAPAFVAGMWMVTLLLQSCGYMKWAESLGGETVQETVKLLKECTDPVILSLMSFAAVIVAPVCEEIVFRGYLYPATKRFAGPWAAAFFSAVVFAGAHGNISAFLPLFLFGLAQVFAYEKTGSIWAPIAGHFCFNGVTVAIQLLARHFNFPLDSGM